jgi:hypothetical protein
VLRCAGAGNPDLHEAHGGPGGWAIAAAATRMLAAKAAAGAPHAAVSVVGEEVRMAGRGGELFFTDAEWTAFVAGARAGECRRELGAVS